MPDIEIKNKCIVIQENIPTIHVVYEYYSCSVEEPRQLPMNISAES